MKIPSGHSVVVSYINLWKFHRITYHIHKFQLYTCFKLLLISEYVTAYGTCGKMDFFSRHLGSCVNNRNKSNRSDVRYGCVRANGYRDHCSAQPCTWASVRPWPHENSLFAWFRVTRNWLFLQVYVIYEFLASKWRNNSLTLEKLVVYSTFVFSFCVANKWFFCENDCKKLRQT